MRRWVVLFTLPHKEHIVQSNLSRRGIETYLPTVKPAYPRRDRRSQIPFFPRYLFAHLDLQLVPRSSLAWSPGVASLVTFGDQVAFVDPHVIDLIRARVNRLNQCGYVGYQRGDVVRIVDGPFRDLEGIFDKPMSPAGRVRILIEVLGRMTACEIDISSVEQVRVSHDHA